jgi:heme-degrading monooxygenase HmoA
MFIAMNRFKVAKGKEADFEAIWCSRKSYLHELEGFIAFSLLKGPERDDHTLYSSHTVWSHKHHFTTWTKSDQFRKAHARAGNDRPLNILGHPEFEGFEVILLEDSRAPRAAAE